MKPATEVAYLSEQNDNLRKEFDFLVGEKLISKSLEIGKSCFGNAPEAINLWIGDERK